VNTGNIRKGSLIFWKLDRPNLIPELFRFHHGRKKLLLDNILAGRMTGTPTFAQKLRRFGGLNQGKIAGPRAQFRLTER
jgi:hypothetical protein